MRYLIKEIIKLDSSLTLKIKLCQADALPSVNSPISSSESEFYDPVMTRILFSRESPK